MKSKNQNGSVLISILFIMPFFMAITAAFLQQAVSNFRVSRQDSYRTQAQFAADGGVDLAMEKFNQDSNWSGSIVDSPSTGGEVELHNDGIVRTTYQTSIEGSGNNRSILSIGRSYTPVKSNVATSTVKLKVALRPITTGEYSIVSGVGGMIMKNSSKIVNGNVYINGKLTMSNTSQIGLSFLPVDVTVAHSSCPSGGGSTYPQICGSGNGQPISLTNSARIYGDVYANNQTDGSRMSNGGLCPSTNSSCSSHYPVPAISLPDYDRAGQKAAVQHNLTGSQAGCSILGAKTWQANTKITGDVSVSGLCIIYVEGNVWITGSLDIRNSATFIVKSGLSDAPVIMVDGADGVDLTNGATILPNLSLTGLRFITYYNSTGNPDANLTGSDLYNSQNLTTIDINNLASAPESEFYSRWSKVVAGNSGLIGALAGQTVELSNSIAITLGTSVTGFGDTVWVIDSYRKVFD